MSKFMDEKNNTYNSVKTVLSDNESIFETYAPLVALYNSFKQDTKQLSDNLQVVEASKGSQNENKLMLFEKMAKLAVRYGRKALPWAVKNKNMDAIKIYDVTKTDFNTSANIALTHAKNVLDQLKTDIANLADYRITQANITELEASITEAESATSQPTVKRKQGVVANKANRTLIRTIDANLDSIENLIVGEYEETEKTFVNLFLSARHITNLGSRSTKLIVTVVDKDGKPVADAYGDVIEMDNEEQYSDENGELTIIGIKNGTYTLEVSLGEAKTSVKFTIKLGEQLKLKVVL